MLALTFSDGPLSNNAPQLGGVANDIFGMNQGNLPGSGLVGGPRMQMQPPQPRTTPPPGLVSEDFKCNSMKQKRTAVILRMAVDFVRKGYQTKNIMINCC